MKNIKLILEYDGSNYHGWQSQKNASAIQDILEGAVLKLTGEPSKIIGSGRTDAGVHALGQVANFFSNAKIPPEKYSYALNSLLPPDIVIKHSEEVDNDFHARFDAIGKTYIYRIRNSIYPSALYRNKELHVRLPLEVSLMRESTLHFLGKHDFAAFQATGSSVLSTVRTIYNLNLSCDGEIITLEITGNGFLYNMVRIITGTLIDVGIGKLKSADIPKILGSRDRRSAGKTVAPHGLYLKQVYY